MGSPPLLVVSGTWTKSGPKSYIFSPNGFRTSHILCVLSVLVQVWDVCGPWNLECPKSVRKVSEKCPKSYIFSPDFGHPAQVPTCSRGTRTTSENVRKCPKSVRKVSEKCPKSVQWSLVCRPHSQPGCI